MMKVLVFDSWSKGCFHITRLLDAFKGEGISLKLLHLGSWGNDVDRPKEEIIDGLDVVDINYYEGMGFKEVLLIEKPDLVIFLSTHTFAHRAFSRYCKILKIPTMLLFHGLVNIQDTVEGSYRVQYLAQIRLVISKLSKLLFKTLPVYCQSLLSTRASFSDWIRFMKDVWSMFVGDDTASKIFSSDSRTTHCCVFTESDVEYAQRCYGFARRDVSVVGNPDLITHGISANDVGIWCQSSCNATKKVIYIESALYKIGLNFSDVDDFIQHLKDTANFLANGGYELVVKLHPSSDRVIFERALKEDKVVFVENNDFVQELLSSQFCITEPSTLAMVPCILGVPLVLASYGKLAGLTYGEVLTSYPKSYFGKSVEGLNHVVQSNEDINKKDLLSGWVDINSGPLPASEMPTRVAKTVTYLTSQN